MEIFLHQNNSINKSFSSTNRPNWIDQHNSIKIKLYDGLKKILKSVF